MDLINHVCKSNKLRSISICIGSQWIQKHTKSNACDSALNILGMIFLQAASVEVKYVPSNGVPKSISIDRIAQAIDDEITYTAELL